MVIFWARCCIILFFLNKIRVALESRALIWVPLLLAITLNQKAPWIQKNEKFATHKMLENGSQTRGQKLVPTKV